MELENAYNEQERTLKINGKYIVIPETFNFIQMASCEMKGLKIDEMRENIFNTMIISYSVIQKISMEEAIEELNTAFKKKEINFKKATELLIMPIANFFKSTDEVQD